MPRDYYEILGVDRAADADTIKKAYRKMAMQFHPDKNPGDKTAEDRFKEAAEAYDVLSSPQKKAQYDRFGHVGGPGQGFGGQGFQDIGDIFDAFGDVFGDFFGGGMGGGRRRRSGPQRGADLRYVLEVELKDVLTGLKKEIEFDADAGCQTCDGSGAKPGSHPKTCSTCGGSGQVIRQQGFFQMATTCNTCQGQGSIIEDKCDTCHGRGLVQKKRKLLVNVPPGVDTGTQLRLTGEGEGGRKGGPAGDLYVEIRVKAHDEFERQGQHLIAALEISYLQALLGAEFSRPTLDGEETIKIPAGTETGELIRISSAGLPSLRQPRRGDLDYEVFVKFPKKLAKKEEKLLREIADLKGESVNTKGSGLFGF